MSPMSVTPAGRCRLEAYGLNLRASCSGHRRPAASGDRGGAGRSRLWRRVSDGHRQLEEVFMSIVGTPAERFEDSDEAAR